MAERGVSHIEMILSFVLFIGFIVAALYFFSPVNSSRLIDSSLAYGLREVEQNTSVDVKILSVKVNPEESTPPRVLAIDVGTDLSESNFAVESNRGLTLPSDNLGEIIYVESENWMQDIFLTITISKAILEEHAEILPKPELKEEYYTLASVVTKKAISEDDFLALNESYFKDYLKLKKYFNLPNRIDFGFALSINPDYKISAQMEKPMNSEVFADSKKVDILRKDGKIEFGEVLMQIW